MCLLGVSHTPNWEQIQLLAARSSVLVLDTESTRLSVSPLPVTLHGVFYFPGIDTTQKEPMAFSVSPERHWQYDVNEID